MSYLEKLEKIMANQREEKDRQPDTFSSNLEHILQLRLSELSKRNIGIKIYSEVVGCEIWLCGNEQMAAQLREDDPEVAVYTANEMRRLMSLTPDRRGLINIHLAKTIFPGSKIIDSRLKETSNESEDA